MRRTPLRRVSVKRRRENRVRRKVMRQIADERGHGCEVRLPGTCTGRAVDGHELLRRSQGGSIVDPANILLVCRACHDWIGERPSMATHFRLSVPSWEARA